MADLQSSPNKGVGIHLEGTLTVGGKKITRLEWNPTSFQGPVVEWELVFPGAGKLTFACADDLSRDLSIDWPVDLDKPHVYPPPGPMLGAASPESPAESDEDDEGDDDFDYENAPKMVMPRTIGGTTVDTRIHAPVPPLFGAGQGEGESDPGDEQPGS